MRPAHAGSKAFRYIGMRRRRRHAATGAAPESGFAFPFQRERRIALPLHVDRRERLGLRQFEQAFPGEFENRQKRHDQLRDTATPVEQSRECNEVTGLEQLHVVERLAGNATTDFGALGVIPSSDRAAVTAADFKRFDKIIRAGWRAADEAIPANRPLSSVSRDRRWPRR